MQYALSTLKIRTLLIIAAHTFCSIKVFGESAKVDLNAFQLQKAKIEALPAAPNHTLKEEEIELPNKSLPLLKVAQKDVMNLLDLLFLRKPVCLPTYIPIIQQLGIRINWFECLKNSWSNDEKSYGAGLDIYFCGPIQLSFDVGGYLADQPKNIVGRDALPYTSEGSYGLGALLYMMHPNPLTNAYCGIGYGFSRFSLSTLHAHNRPPRSKPFGGGWIKLVVGSEQILLPQLYGGMQLSVAYLAHSKKNDDPQVSNYAIPGYGKVVNKMEFDIALYLKWSISFLEKKIVL